MRITNSLMSKNFMRNLNNNMKSVYKYQEQLSTMEQVSRPSDDPLKVSKVLDLNNEIKQNEEYKSTINDSIDFTNAQDSALANATNSMQRIYTLTQQAANGTYNDQDRDAIRTEVENEIDTLMDSLNTSFGGRYIFAGNNTTTKPFEKELDDDGNFAGIIYNGTTEEDGVSGNTTKEIARGVNVELQTDGRALMNSQGEEDNLGTFFNELLTALDGNDTAKLSEDLLERVDSEMNNIVNLRTNIGATTNRLKAAKDRNESEFLNLKTTYSNTQDIDLAETYMQYSMEMVAYEASLQMGNKILQSSLLNYM
ncbi:flagellar hook-associated protein FlgL [Marinilactibacillus psychrotolerans]|uniref:flagellar hook-associated protein FlgL n=1 Tax=Marinilactibacillus psychrotolerans TaxID=191770 RepID=UPI001C7CFF27|nr:flagellar hook-associated protein FlgL [Marinilactibacillus psychrotolerans]GEQ34424.1 flagellar hook-associated protein FlgL [Marinilactibacillus psychrotolerans]